MTHAQNRPNRPVPAPHAPPDREIIREMRGFADFAGLPGVCPHEACRRAQRCQGPVKVPEVFGPHPLPFCVAEAFDGMFEPVVRWSKLMKPFEEAAAKQPRR